MNHRVAEIRKELDLNQEEFADRLGLKQTALSMIESGKNALTEKNIKIICSVLNVSETWLRTGIGPMFEASPYEKEFFAVYKTLLPETQKALLKFAKELLKVQKKTAK
ncbi:helix-turn-helix domain-containing protein [Leadbettera azotonutricia]|uniref:Transcriptional regulator n=1 Tax=Leadbettera azotonutricia (strain ATCC BAA-888 / DSM 13862 / ZAS-9) TaxID=545695 RepID=F5YBD4_LEAAZ|nr:helix-turn-helix transcriptional regulator [Leadbettera azotonutricia]AEF80551.1 transcriptional regulator [Leadbettera azotonutricia ZAS-9]